MKSFNDYLNEIGEIGYVKEIRYSILYVAGLPTVKPSEIVLFESGEVGQVLSVDAEYAEVIIFSNSIIRVGTRVVRSNELYTLELSDELFERTIDPLGNDLWSKEAVVIHPKDKRYIDSVPSGITERKSITEAFETGVSLIDLIIPLGKGQRELVIGDRKTGKTIFLLQAIATQVQRGTICIYGAIAKRPMEIRRIEEYLKTNKLISKCIIVATSSSDPSGLIFMTPYAAMTIAEYFRDQGKDVLVILDDLSRHAQFYREITLLARRFPGRDSYPGDVFYIHSRLLERAGKFRNGSITCLPVVEAIAGNISGYIQTNIMSMTDGHLFFDTDLFNQGMRPAVNSFLSVTRVGLQAQSEILRDVSRQHTSFLVRLGQLQQLLHFGVEISPEVKNSLALGEKINEFFKQPYEKNIPLAASLYIVAILWSGKWKEKNVGNVRNEVDKIVNRYLTDEAYRQRIERFIAKFQKFDSLILELQTIRTI